MKIAIIIPVIELLLSITATIVPLNAGEVESKLPMLIGTITMITLGEVVRIWSVRGRKEEFKGFTPELASKQLAAESYDVE